MKIGKRLLMCVLCAAGMVCLSAADTAGQELPVVKLNTPLGEISIAVDTINAPVTARNFLSHVQKGTYQNACFYRVVKDDNQPFSHTKIEVVQAGLYNEQEIGKYPGIVHETTDKSNLRHLDGTVSMARAEPGTASTEFFICIGDQPELDFGGKRNPDGQGFAAFGNVTAGMEVIKSIQQLPDVSQYLSEPVQFLSVFVLE